MSIVNPRASYSKTAPLDSSVGRTTLLISQQSSEAGLFLVACFIILIALNIAALPNDDTGQASLATLILIVSAYPTWIYIRKGRQSLPLVPIIAAIYGLYFALPVLTPFDAPIRLSQLPREDHIQALWLTLLGMITMLIVYYKCPKNMWIGWMPQYPGAAWSDARAISTAWILGLIGLTANVLYESSAIPTSIILIILFISQFAILAICILFYLYLQRKLPMVNILFLWLVLVPIEIAIDLSTGLLFALFRDVLSILLVYLLVKRRIPWAFSIIVLVISLLLLQTKAEFRKLAWNGESINIATKVTIYVQLAQDFGSNATITDFTDGLGEIVARINNHALFAYVINATPSRVPYWGGATYAPLLTRLIPRALWPDKPQEVVGQEFGHRYGLLDESDTGTSLNTPQLIELYANFGGLGVIVGMGIIGLLYNLLGYVLEHERANEWNYMTAVVVYSFLFGVDGNFSLVFGNILYWIILFYFLGRAIFPRRA